MYGLVLSRRAGETICIGDDITITVVEITEKKVRLGIDAPKSVPIWRAEIAPGVERVETIYGPMPVGGEG